MSTIRGASGRHALTTSLSTRNRLRVSVPRSTCDGVRGSQADQSFAVLHRLDYQVWDAWQHPSYLEGQAVTVEPPVLLTRNGVSYEMALMTAFRAMGDDLPDTFQVIYLR